jgi:pyruvate/2-oxoglutarate dehydrogenase complex dihydrolipoamide acyltransferase (E2) component
MHEPKGKYLRLAGPRRFIGDLVHFAHRIPSAPVSRVIDVKKLIAPRSRHAVRPSWASIFMKSYALVGAEHAPLRRSLLEFPWPRVYEHPWMNCALAIERTYRGEDGVFVGIFRAPEQQSLAQLQQAVDWYKNETLEKVGFYRMALRFSQAPTPIRRLLWWGTLNLSGYKRCKRFGTFGLSSYGSLGAEQVHPISPLTTTLTYGPIDPGTGHVVVKLIYDHRILDGAYVARRLRDIEETLNGSIAEELLAGSSAVGPAVPAETGYAAPGARRSQSRASPAG